MCLLTATVYLDLEVTSGIFKGLAERNLNIWYVIFPNSPCCPYFLIDPPIVEAHDVLNERVQQPDQVRRRPWRICIEAAFTQLFSLRLCALLGVTEGTGGDYRG